jgi:hypothetical protein
MEYNGYKPGYIYVLKSGPYYKIGFADDVAQRLKNVASAVSPDLPEPITLLFSFPTTSKLIAERALHELFRQSRTKGEWFQLADRHLSMLQRFADGYSVDEFVMHNHRLPDDLVLFSDSDIEFFIGFDLIYPRTEAHPDITGDNLVEMIGQEKSKRARASRAIRYKETLRKLLDSMSVDDMEWIYETIMLRGVRPE